MVDGPTHGPLEALVVGGAGMLHGTCLALAASGWRVAIVGRDSWRLERLAREAQGQPGSIVPVTCDYADPDTYEGCLREHVDRSGPIRLVLSWIPGGAEDALRKTLDIVERKPLESRMLVQVRASSMDAPGTQPLPAKIELGPSWTARTVTLGFGLEQDGRMRWLTDREIAQGLTQAIEDSGGETIVGSVKPWSIKS